MAAEALVPYKYPVSLNGTAFMVDTAMGDAWRHETVPLLRQQADQSAQPSVESLNPEAEWRRTWTSFHKGAGQIHRDREDSSPFRFRASVGVDIWTRNELKVLPSVTNRGSGDKLVVAGNRLFRMRNSGSVQYTEAVTSGAPTWTDCTNEPGGALTDIASDGKYVWITDGSNSYWALASASPPAFNLAGWTGTQDVDVFNYVKGRLIGGHDNTLHYYDAAGAATSITIAATLPDNFDFVGFAGGPSTSVIYAAGFAGDKSLILRIGIKDDGTGLDVAIPAGELPDGEIVRAIDSYLGFVLIGTDNGVRFATPDATGNLTIGALLETGAPCRCFEGQGPYVWFGWDTYVQPDGGSTQYSGLGRLSLEEFSSADRLAPAYATDLMQFAAHAAVTSVVTFQGRRIFCCNNDVWIEDGTASNGTVGYLLTGWTDMGFTGNKIPLAVDVDANSTTADGRNLLAIRTQEAATFTSVGNTAYTTGAYSYTYDLTPTASPTFELAIGLQEHTVVAPQYRVRSFTLRSIPAVAPTTLIQVPLLLVNSEDSDGGVVDRDVETLLAAIEALVDSRAPVTYQEISRTYTVSVEDKTWLPTLGEDPVTGWAVEGTCLVKLKELT